MMHDLVVLVPDIQMEQTVKGLLSRPEALQMRPVSYKIFRHPNHDAGMPRTAHGFLRIMTAQYERALVMFDYDGCGMSDRTPQVLEDNVEKSLNQNGWDQRAAVVVLEPELESWVWSPSPHVERCLGWQDREPGLRRWLLEKGLWKKDSPKPEYPKKAMEAALWFARKPRSSSIYLELAQCVSVKHCEERSFKKFLEVLRNWFPESRQHPVPGGSQFS